jgi:hypothetical protein
VLTARGGHLGFHGQGSRVPWHDRVTAWWLARKGFCLDQPLRDQAANSSKRRPSAYNRVLPSSPTAQFSKTAAINAGDAQCPSFEKCW